MKTTTLRTILYVVALLLTSPANAQVLLYRFSGRVHTIGIGKDTRQAVSGIMIFDAPTSTGYHITQTRIGTQRYFAIRDLDDMETWRAIGPKRHHIILIEQEPNRHVIAFGASTTLRTSSTRIMQYPRSFQLTGVTLGGPSTANAEWARTTVTYSYSTRYSILANDYQFTADELMLETRAQLLAEGAIEE